MSWTQHSPLVGWDHSPCSLAEWCSWLVSVFGWGFRLGLWLGEDAGCAPHPDVSLAGLSIQIRLLWD